MSKKYYAVKKGRVTGIFMGWEGCSNSIKGYKGSEYKSFSKLEDAKQYLNNKK